MVWARPSPLTYHPGRSGLSLPPHIPPWSGWPGPPPSYTTLVGLACPSPLTYPPGRAGPIPPPSHTSPLAYHPGRSGLSLPPHIPPPHIPPWSVWPIPPPSHTPLVGLGLSLPPHIPPPSHTTLVGLAYPSPLTYLPLTYHPGRSGLSLPPHIPPWSGWAGPSMGLSTRFLVSPEEGFTLDMGMLEAPLSALARSRFSRNCLSLVGKSVMTPVAP